MGGLLELREFRQGRIAIKAIGGALDGTGGTSVLDPGDAKVLILDLRHLLHVASAGVRDWIRDLSAIRKHLDELYFLNVSPRITDQFNMIVGFDSGGSLLSFQTVYVCPHDDEETIAVFDTQLDRNLFETREPPIRQCQVCGREAELDDDPMVLFEYARSMTSVPLPPDVERLLQAPESWIDVLPGRRARARCRREGVVGSIWISGVIDENLPIHLPKSLEGAQIIRIFMRRVQNVDVTGFDQWRGLLKTIRDSGASLELLQVPPVFLRRGVENASLLSGAELNSVIMPWRSSGKSTGLQWAEHSSGPEGLSLKNIEPPVDDAELVLQKDDVTSFDALIHAPVFNVHSSGAMRAPVPTDDLTEGPNEPIRPTQIFDDKYEILCKLGQGGMAAVYLVRQAGAVGFKRLVVIKRVLNEFLTDDRLIRLFLDEARVAARIEQNNVIRVIDLGRAEGTYYMVMEFVHGRSLAEVLKALKKRGEHAPPALAATMIADLCAGLARAHKPDAQGNILVHRDVTPANVIVSFDGGVKLLDFGLAGYQHFKRDKLREGHILGSVPYLPPELLRGEEALPESDLWGAGLILYLLHTVHHPFKGRTVTEVYRMMMKSKLKRPWGVLPRRLHKIILKCCALDPKSRYASAGTVERDLRLAAAKLSKDDVDIGAWIRNLFADEVAIEKTFMDTHNASTLADALLKAPASEIQDLYVKLGKKDAIHTSFRDEDNGLAALANEDATVPLGTNKP